METESALRKENIAEYLLYMFQMEDLARAFNLDGELMARKCLGENARKEDRQRLEEICEMMRQEGLQAKGHLQVNKNILLDLEDVHALLMRSGRYPDYANAFFHARTPVEELQMKAGAFRKEFLETCFEALYGELLLRMSHKSTSEGTQEGLDAIRAFVGRLAAYYKRYKEEQLDLD